MPDVSILKWRQPYLETSQVPPKRESAVAVTLGVLRSKERFCLPILRSL